MKCTECGRDAFLVKKPVVLYDGISVKNVFLRNAETEVCRFCGYETIAVRNIKRVHLMIALGIALQPARLSGDEVRFLRKAIRMSLSEWAARIGIAPETFSRWENGRSPAQQVEKLARIDFLITITKDLTIDVHLPDAILEVLTSDLSDKRGFAIVIDIENLDAQPEYANLGSPEFAMPNFAHIEAPLLSVTPTASVRLYNGRKMLVVHKHDTVQSGENKDVCNAFAAAA